MLLLRQCRESETSLAMEQTFFVSVIIPTYNRAELLRRTLDSFLQQSYPEDLYEIIIANNNSSDRTEEVASQYIEDYPDRVRYLQERRQGVHYARNSAAKIAKGDILYFTDDDMIADRDLLCEIVKVFSFDPKVASVTGRILPKWEIEPPDWVPKLCYNGLLSLNDPVEDFIISPRDCNIWSCHQAVRRDVFFQSGGFNPENTAGEWVGDGETGLNIKIRELGYKFGYNGASIIYHIIPSSRMTQAYINKRMSNQGNSDCYTDYRKNLYSKTSLIIQIIRHFLGLLISGIKFSINLGLGRIAWHINQGRVFYFWSRMRYDYRILTDEAWLDLVLRRDWLIE
jgi:glycosyltransferase involved in cell wall biosynthesis